jgi:hypothetical protein
VSISQFAQSDLAIFDISDKAKGHPRRVAFQKIIPIWKMHPATPA